MSPEPSKIVIRPKARRDLVDLVTYIAKDSADSASRLLDASEETLNFLATNNEAGAIYKTANPRLQQLRVFQVRGFRNHLVFYIPRTPGIEVVRVLHGARNIESALNLD